MRKCVVAKGLLLLANQKLLILMRAFMQGADLRRWALSLWKSPTKSLRLFCQFCTNDTAVHFALNFVHEASSQVTYLLGWGSCEVNLCFFPLLGKGRRLKQAKEEAIAEIDHYRLQKEKEFRNKQMNVSETCVGFCSKPNCFKEQDVDTHTN